MTATAPIELVVRTQQGLIEGFEQDGIRKFFGVPYAQAPVGDLRWRQPVYPPENWNDVRPAKAFSAAPYQTISVPMPLRSNGISEDCLYLNVWTQTTEREAKQPVLVWFFGGGNLRGAGSMAHVDGTELAKLGATVVNPNYRVGPLGFLNDEEMGANFAVGDQIAVLRWVRDNIAALGGDPNRVLIFGNSAGAVSVRSLLDAPAARGLFHRAFMQSAGFDEPANGNGWSFDRSREATHKLWGALGSDEPEVLRTVAVDRIGAAAHPLSGIFPDKDHVHTPLNLVWMPVSDGEVVTGGEAGWAEDVPLMIGVTEHEARWSLSPTEHYSETVLANMARYFAGERADEVLAILASGAGRSVFERLDQLYTYGVWTEPAYAMMKRYATQGRTLYYVHFARSGPEAVVTNRLASHGAPVPYFFRTMPDDGTYDDVDRRISFEMMHALIEFAKTGVPRSSGGNAWPIFDPASPRETLISESISAATYRVTPLLRALNALRGGVEADTSSPKGLFAAEARSGTPRLTPAAEGHQIHYDVEGQGDHTMVLIHGGMCDRSYWWQQVGALSARFRVINLDLTGHGDTGGCRTGWSVEQFADDVVRVVNDAGGDRFVLAGHSLGGIIALDVARRLGSRAAGAVVVDMLHAPDGTPPPPPLDPDAMAAMMRRGMFTPSSDPALADRVITGMLAFPPEVAGCVRAAAARFDPAGALAMLSETPVALILSDSRPIHADKIRALHAGAKIYRVSGEGHFLMIEAPDTVNDLLATFARASTGAVEEL